MRWLLMTILLSLAAPAPRAQAPPDFQVGHTNDILTVRFSPDDRQLISYSAGDGRLCMWDVASGRLLWMTQTEFVQKCAEYYTLEEFHWSADRRFVITKSANGTYQSWDALTGRIHDYTETPLEIPLIADPVRSVSVTGDDSAFRLTDTTTRQTLTVKKGFSRLGDTYDVSHDGKLFAEGGSWGDAAIKLTELRSGRSWFLSGHPGVVRAVAYSPDGKFLAVGGDDRNVYIFDMGSLSLARTLVGHTKPITSVAFSPNGKFLVSSSEDQLMKEWLWREGRCVHEIRSDADIFGIQRVSFSPDGSRALTTSDRVEFRLWDTQHWTLIRNFMTNEPYTETSGNMAIRYQGVPVTAARFAQDGKSIVSAHVDGTIRIWDADSGEQLKSLKVGDDAVALFDCTPGLKTLLVAIRHGEELRIGLLDPSTGGVIAEFPPDAVSSPETLCLSPDGTRFATSDITGDVVVWDLHRRQPVRHLDVGYSGSDAIAFSPDGKTVVVGGMNQNLFVFDVETGAKLWQLIPSYKPSELEVSLAKAQEARLARINEAEARRDNRAAVDTEAFKKQVYITFDHYGEMTDRGKLRMMESDSPKLSKVIKPRAAADAIWLRLHNDSPLPVQVPTQSFYLPNAKCFFEFSKGNRVLGLCDNREISIWFGVEDRDHKRIPDPFDVGSDSILLPKTSALFAVPIAVLQEGRSIDFDFKFQAPDIDGKIGDYGTPKHLRFGRADIPYER